MTKYVAYKIEDDKFQFVQSWVRDDLNSDYSYTDNPKLAQASATKVMILQWAAQAGLTIITLDEAISLMPEGFFTHRENVTKQAAIPFAESIINLLQQSTPTKLNDRLMYNAHLQACGNQLLELIKEFANDY